MSCKFECQAIEYWWWSTAAYTGLLKNRSNVKKEFKYYLAEDFKAKDPKMYALMTVRCRLQTVSLSKISISRRFNVNSEYFLRTGPAGTSFPPAHQMGNIPARKPALLEPMSSKG